MNPIGACSSQLNNSSNKVNSYGGTSYVSINQIVSYNTSNSYVRSSSGVVTSGVNCGTESYFRQVGFYRQCVDSCPSFLPKKAHYFDGTVECIDMCYSGFEYTEGSLTCRQKCTNFINYNGTINTSDTSGSCISTCSTSKFQLSHPALLYANNTRKIYCRSSCNYSTYTRFYRDGTGKKCTDVCANQGSQSGILSHRSYLDGSECVSVCTGAKEFVDYAANFNQTDEYGTCVACTTSSFQLISEKYKYVCDDCDASEKKYCLSTCDRDEFTKYYLNGSVKICTNSCLVEEATVTMLPDLRYHFTSGGETQCVVKCPSSHPFINEAHLFNTDGEYGECVSSCPSTHYQLKHPSLKYKIDESEKMYCSSSCYLGDFQLFYHFGGIKHCIDSCTSEFGENKRYLQINSAGQRECIEECPFFLKDTEFFNSTLEYGNCVDECDEFTMRADDIKWPSNAVKAYCIPNCTALAETHPYSTLSRECVTSCQDAGFTYTMEDKTCSDTCEAFILNTYYCVSKCPEDLPFSEDKHCVARCSVNKPFIRDLSTCETGCPILKFNEYCVDRCDSPALITYFSEKSIPYLPMPFILTTKTCSDRCAELAAPFVNELSLECMSECPPECEQETCEYDHLVYKNPNNYCREKCTDPTFPLVDNTSMECLPECRTERPFVFEEECLEKCPLTHSLVARRANCEDATCGSECDKFTLFCVNACPEDLPFKLKREDSSFCVCQCPEFYVVESKECKLFCDPIFGMVPNETQDSCLHCYRDLDKQFFHIDQCVATCPPGTSFNQNHVCTPCFDLNLWTNEKNICVPFSKCYYLSYFDYESKTCTACDKEGFMITKRNTDLACEQTDCANGFISEEGDQPICVFCESSEFFLDPECTELCPPVLEYDFYSRLCISCSSVCSCCKNGSCKLGKCECKSGWIGKKCDIPQENTLMMTTSIVDFLKRRLSVGLLAPNDNELITEVATLYSSELTLRQLQADPEFIYDFMKRILVQIHSQRVKYAYQPTLLNTLDRLLQLALIHASKTEDSRILQEGLALLYEVTDDIQLFNVTMSVILEFEIVTEASFTGVTFDLTFGTDITKTDRVDLVICLEKIKNKFSLSPTHLFPFRLLILKGLLTETEPQQDPFVASSKPLMMVWLYLEQGVVDINTVCEEKFIDVSFEVELPPKADPENQKINLTGINVFKKEDPFFNDRCVPASDGTDLTISQRKAKLFVDSSSACAESPSKVCQIQGVDENNKAKCACRGIQNSKKSAIESTFSSYPKSNYILVTCLTTFKEAILTENIGFYTIITPCLLAIILVFLFNINVDRDLTDKRRFQYMRTDIELFDSDCMDPEIYFNECFDLKNRLDPIVLRVKKDMNFDFSSLPTLPDLSHLSIREQLKLDKRPNWQYANDIFLYENTLYYTFFSKSLIDPKPFLIVLYISELNLSIMLNSFFIDDDLVESFNESEEHSIFSSFTDELPKTIWALVTAKVLMGVLTFFYSFGERSTKLFLKRLVLTKDESAVKAYNLFLNDHMWRLVGLSVLVVPFNLFCLYFVVIYAEIYSNSIGIWINGIIMGLILDNVVVEGLPALLLVFSRVIAKAYPSVEFIFILVSKLNALKKLQLLG